MKWPWVSRSRLIALEVKLESSEGHVSTLLTMLADNQKRLDELTERSLQMRRDGFNMPPPMPDPPTPEPEMPVEVMDAIEERAHPRSPLYSELVSWAARQLRQTDDDAAGVAEAIRVGGTWE